jgi:hypothetical protein
MLIFDFDHVRRGSRTRSAVFVEFFKCSHQAGLTGENFALYPRGRVAAPPSGCVLAKLEKVLRSLPNGIFRKATGRGRLGGDIRSHEKSLFL